MTKNILSLEKRTEKCRITRSGFIRNLILNRKLTPKYQIARHFNSGGERSLAMQEELQPAIAELYTLRKEVLRLAGDYSGNS